MCVCVVIKSGSESRTSNNLGWRAPEKLDVGTERELGEDAVGLAVLLFLERLLQREPLIVEERDAVGVDADHAVEDGEVGG
jgi:hypothetical protein